MQEDTAQKQRKTCLSVGTAFDQLQFVVEPLHYPIAPRFWASVGNHLCIIRQPIDKADAFLDRRGVYGGFPLFQSVFSLALPQQLAEILSQGVDDGNSGINLTHLRNRRSLALRE